MYSVKAWLLITVGQRFEHVKIILTLTKVQHPEICLKMHSTSLIWKHCCRKINGATVSISFTSSRWLEHTFTNAWANSCLHTADIRSRAVLEVSVRHLKKPITVAVMMLSSPPASQMFLSSKHLVTSAALLPSTLETHKEHDCHISMTTVSNEFPLVQIILLVKVEKTSYWDFSSQTNYDTCAIVNFYPTNML